MRNYVTCDFSIFTKVLRQNKVMWEGVMEYTGENKEIYTKLSSETRWNEHLGRPKYRWENSIKLDIN
jgi:hypothetical protein